MGLSKGFTSPLLWLGSQDKKAMIGTCRSYELKPQARYRTARARYQVGFPCVGNSDSRTWAMPGEEGGSILGTGASYGFFSIKGMRGHSIRVAFVRPTSPCLSGRFFFVWPSGAGRALRPAVYTPASSPNRCGGGVLFVESSLTAFEEKNSISSLPGGGPKQILWPSL